VPQQLAPRVSISREEFEAFLAENQELVERCEKLIVKIDALEKLNKNLDERLRTSEQKLSLVEQNNRLDLESADETLRKSRAIMTWLLQETDRRLTEEGGSNPH